jgi:hypothetical protein
MDRIITSKFKRFFVLSPDEAPNQGKFVYEFSLDNDTPLDILNFYWGSNNKSSDIYILMSRFSKTNMNNFSLDETSPIKKQPGPTKKVRTSRLYNGFGIASK